jgi:hypothetical protein
MPDLSITRRLPLGHLPQVARGRERARPAWWPAWSRAAALRAVRAVLVIPPLFALTFEGFGNLQMTLFAATADDIKACQAAKHQLMTAFASTPYRPVGLATADQGLASVVQLLEWCTALVADATDGHPNLDQAAPPDRDLVGQAAAVLGQAGDLLADGTSAPGDGRHPPAVGVGHLPGPGPTGSGGC